MQTTTADSSEVILFSATLAPVAEPTPSSGYANVRFNAIKHGVLSRHILLAHEDGVEFEDLLAALVTEHQPSGPTETHLVEELAGAIWRKRRVLQGFKLTGDVPDLAAAILAAVGAGAVVFVDTLNRAAPMADENSSRDMGEILEGAKELQKLTAGLVVLVHHTGKDAARGLRGHSSLFAALDAAIEVSRNGDRREWKVSKAKDGADGEAFPFRLEVVQLAPDSDGEPVSSCVVRRDMSAAEVARVKLPQGGNQRIVLDALRPMFKASARFGMGGAPAMRPCIELEAAIGAAGAALPCASDRRTERTRQAITGLLAHGVLGCGEGWLWLT